MDRARVEVRPHETAAATDEREQHLSRQRNVEGHPFGEVKVSLEYREGSVVGVLPVRSVAAGTFVMNDALRDQFVKLVDSRLIQRRLLARLRQTISPRRGKD